MGIQAIYIDETVPLTALLARIFYGRSTAFTVADFFTDIYFNRESPFHFMGRIICRIDTASWRLLPLIFTRAKSTRTYLESIGVPSQNVHPVYDPCDFSIYHPIQDRDTARNALGIKPDDVVLVHHGILHPNKGNARIIEALALMKNEYPQLRYLLIGDGPDMKPLRNLTEKLGMSDRVIFTGWLPTLHEVNNALNAGDIGLVMRIGERSDDFHMTGALVHSMAVGLPVIAAHLAGVAEVIKDNVNGFLFNPNDMAGFRSRLSKLIENPTLRSKYGQRTYEMARELFDMDTVVHRTSDPLLELAGVPHTHTQAGTGRQKD
jgi:glycosyltransferase involved in cell wall biosynthesis